MSDSADPNDVSISTETWEKVQGMADRTYSGKDGDKLDDFYTIGDELGRGRFSTVFAGQSLKSNKEVVAIKVVENDQLDEEENLEALQTEIDILRKLNHPNIVKLKEVVTTPANTYIVMELLAGGELFERIKVTGNIPEIQAKTLFAAIYASLDHLHNLDIVHRDIKPENILFTADGSMDIKLIDFGYAGKWTPEQELDGLCGTPDYVAPEVLTWYYDEDDSSEIQGVKYGKSSDLWSVGVLLYVILSGCSPFDAEEEEDLLKQVASAQYQFPDNEWAEISSEAKSLIKGLLTENPKDRMTLAEMRTHPWAKKEIDDYLRKIAGDLDVTEIAVKNEKQGGGSCCTIL